MPAMGVGRGNRWARRRAARSAGGEGNSGANNGRRRDQAGARWADAGETDAINRAPTLSRNELRASGAGLALRYRVSFMYLWWLVVRLCFGGQALTLVLVPNKPAVPARDLSRESVGTPFMVSVCFGPPPICARLLFHLAPNELEVRASFMPPVLLAIPFCSPSRFPRTELLSGREGREGH